jgi:uncharacterized Zn finger protein
MYYQQWAPYVPVAERRRKAAAEMAKMRTKGHAVSPVVITGRTIASTTWGKAWCNNMESYSDYSNRLPRGRTYVRNGSVVDLQIATGRIEARVAGSSLYKVTITVKAVQKDHWQAMCEHTAGSIDSLVELLQGKFSKGVMDRLCRQGDGLFPTPKEIHFDCSCPDGAYMCKHVAAVLYGIGARLDHQPEHLFTLRQIDPKDLLAKAGSGLSTSAETSERMLADADVAGIFDLELDAGQPEKTTEKPAKKVKTSPAKKTARAAAPTGRDLYTRLYKLLKKTGSVNSTSAQTALKQPAAILRPLFERLLTDGHATVTGKTRGKTYHIVK